MTITFAKKSYDSEEITASLHPLVKDWFFSKFKDYTPPQKFSILNIQKRKNTLISSPTGSGKTLSAFLAILNDLVISSLSGTLEDKIYAVYLSPLKALGNDIHRNLIRPLEELESLASKDGRRLNIRVAVRTGDSTASQKASMLKKPPHILITTPESLTIMITTKKFKEHFRDVSWVIVDEIHSLAENKRGVHLSLTLERFELLSRGFCRIALSATVSPLEEVAKFLVGYSEKGVLRDCEIVDVNHLKRLDLKVLSPVKNLIREDYDVIAKKTYELIDKLVQEHKTTLIFTNTRSATERVVHHLKEMFPRTYAVITDVEDINQELVQQSVIAAHHGSLSKEHRLWVEEQLKDGKLKVVVSSTSLELGIDIGNIDLVILLGSPKSVARALQRIGRSGHKLHEKSKGRIIVQDRDDLVESSVLLKAAIEGKIDRINIPVGALDVLAQHIIGMAIDGSIKISDVWKTITSSYCYADIDRKDFDALLSYLSGEFVSLEDRYVYAKIWKDDTLGVIGRRGKLARLIYMTNSGTIPDETNVKVKFGNSIIGTISEPFLERLRKGDVFVLGGETYQFRYSLGLTAFVTSAVGRKPTVPSWYSEMLPLSFDLACELQKFRLYLNNYFEAKRSRSEIMDYIRSYLYIDEWGLNSIYEFFAEQYKFLEIPHKNKLLIEHYDDGRNKYILFHSLYGRRVNDVLSRCVAYVIGRLQHRDAEILINDNGFAVRTNSNVQAARALRLLRSDEIRRVAEKAVEQSEVLARRFRHCAARSFMILRNYKGKSKSVGKQQMSSRLLLKTVKELDDDFVILKEARREVLEDLMDISGATMVIKNIELGKISLKEVHTTIPSPFAFNIIMTGYADILKMSDRQAFLRKMHELVLAKISLKGDDPEGLLGQARQNPSFEYDDYWNVTRRKEELKKEDSIIDLLNDLRIAVKKHKVDPIIVKDLQMLIIEDDEKYRFREETVDFIEELLSGTIDMAWTDGLIRSFKEKLPEIRWRLR